MIKKNKWSKELVLLEALKFTDRREWREKSHNSYRASILLGIKDECYSHMAISRNPYINGAEIYVFEFDDNSAYVGLSSDLSTRFANHMDKGPVSKKIQEGKIFKFKILETNVPYPLKAQEQEFFWFTFYKINHWDVINDESRIGSLGGMVGKWTENEITKASLKFSTIKDWRTNDEPSYRAALRRGLLKKLSSSMLKSERDISKVSFAKGSKHGNSKLKEEDIKIIRNMANDGVTQLEIAKSFNIHQSSVSDILLGKLWRHV